MEFNEAFEKFVKGQTVKNVTTIRVKFTFMDGLLFENNYSYVSYGGGAGGEDYNEKYIISPKGEIIAEQNF